MAQEFTQNMLNLLEEYTNTGNIIEGVKYEGASVVMKSHIIVFSNHPPPAGILQKKVYHLKLRQQHQQGDDLKWEMPGQQERQTVEQSRVEQGSKEKNIYIYIYIYII